MPGLQLFLNDADKFFGIKRFGKSVPRSQTPRLGEQIYGRAGARYGDYAGVGKFGVEFADWFEIERLVAV